MNEKLIATNPAAHPIKKKCPECKETMTALDYGYILTGICENCGYRFEQ